MVRHIIIWNLRDDLSPEEKRSKAAEIKQKLEALNGVIPGLKELHVYTELLSSSTGDIMLDVLFMSEQALSSYQTDPRHLEAAGIVRSVTSVRSCADLEI